MADECQKVDKCVSNSHYFGLSQNAFNILVNNNTNNNNHNHSNHSDCDEISFRYRRVSCDFTNKNITIRSLENVKFGGMLVHFKMLQVMEQFLKQKLKKMLQIQHGNQDLEILKITFRLLINMVMDMDGNFH